MSLRVQFKPVAEKEFFDAISWYESQEKGLGCQFSIEVTKSLKRAFASPETFRKVRGEVRKIRLHRFKSYGIYFAFKGQTLYVIAIFHASRNPDNLWRRLG